MMKKSVLIILLCIALFAADEVRAIERNYDKIMLNLQSGNYQTRLSAVEDLGKIRDEASVRMLISVVADRQENWRIQIRAIRFLGEIGHPDSADILIKTMQDPFRHYECPAIKWNTAVALGSFKKNSKVVDVLINALNDKILYVREAAIQSLGEIAESRTAPQLIPLLEDKSFAIKLSTIQALGKIGDPQAIPSLKQIAANNTDEHIKAAAVKALNNIQ